MTELCVFGIKVSLYIVAPTSLLTRSWAAQLTAANTDRKQGLWQWFWMSAYHTE